MAKIREDLEGVVVAVGETGQPVILRAGATVPKGVEVGSHALAAKSGDDNDTDNASGSATGSPDASELALPPRGGAGSGADAWRAYGVAAAKAKGFEIDIPADATKTDIIEALKSVDIPVE